MNCIIVDDDKLSRKIIEEFVNKTESLTLMDSFVNAVDAANYLKKKDGVDLIFLDIEMPEMTGIEFLNSIENPPQVVVISSKEKYALNAFEYDVVDYLLKPVSYSRFFKAIDRAAKRFNKDGIPSKKEEIFIKRNFSLIRLKYSDILWVEALENYVIFNTFDDKFTVHFTMKAVEHKLPVDRFLRLHRSFIVNLSAVEIIEDNSVLIRTQDGMRTIPIGKSYREKLMKDINFFK